MTVQPWSITQLGGDKNTLALGDYAAPFGRPRKGAVVKVGASVRRKRTYYPGNQVPTRHTFGIQHKDWELHGRWMDYALGAPGKAQAKYQQAIEFLAAEQPCTVSWGSVLAATGMVVDFDAEFESPAQIAWKLTIEIDSNDTLRKTPRTVVPARPGDQLAQVLQIVANFPGTPQIPQDIPFPFPSNILETIDGLVSTINGYTSALLSVANDIDSYAKASVTELNRLLGGINQIQSAALILKETFSDSVNDFAVGSANANSQTTFALARATAVTDSLLMLAILADMNVQVKRSLAGTIGKTSRAKGNDSWESLSLKHYGSIDRADDLRQANAARYGEKPRAGRTIHVPKA